MKYKKPYRVKRKKSLLRNRFFSFSVLSSVFLGIVFYFFVFSEVFQVKNIKIAGETKVPLEELMTLAENNLEEKLLFLKSKSVFLVNSGQIKTAILDKFPQIGEVKISRSFANAITVEISERKAVAMFCQDNELAEKCFLFDAKGIIFEMSGDGANQYTRVRVADNIFELKLGQKILEPELVSIISKIQAQLANDFKIALKEILFVSEERLSAKTNDGWEIYFNSQNDLNWQLTKLKAVLEKEIPQEKRKKLEYIDLRFGNLAPYKYR